MINDQLLNISGKDLIGLTFSYPNNNPAADITKASIEQRSSLVPFSLNNNITTDRAQDSYMQMIDYNGVTSAEVIEIDDNSYVIKKFGQYYHVVVSDDPARPDRESPLTFIDNNQVTVNVNDSGIKNNPFDTFLNQATQMDFFLVSELPDNASQGDIEEVTLEDSRGSFEIKTRAIRLNGDWAVLYSDMTITPFFIKKYMIVDYDLELFEPPVNTIDILKPFATLAQDIGRWIEQETTKAERSFQSTDEDIYNAWLTMNGKRAANPVPLPANRIKEAINNTDDPLHVIFSGWSSTFVDWLYDRANILNFENFSQFTAAFNYFVIPEIVKTHQIINNPPPARLGQIPENQRIPEYDRYQLLGWMDTKAWPQSRHYLDYSALQRNRGRITEALINELGAETINTFNYNHNDTFSLDELRDVIFYFWSTQDEPAEQISIEKVCQLLGIDYLPYEHISTASIGMEDVFRIDPSRYIAVDPYKYSQESSLSNLSSLDSEMAALQREFKTTSQRLSQINIELLRQPFSPENSYLTFKEKTEQDYFSLRFELLEKQRDIEKQRLIDYGLSEQDQVYVETIKEINNSLIYCFARMITYSSGRLRDLSKLTSSEISRINYYYARLQNILKETNEDGSIFEINYLNEGTIVNWLNNIMPLYLKRYPYIKIDELTGEPIVTGAIEDLQLVQQYQRASDSDQYSGIPLAEVTESILNNYHWDLTKTIVGFRNLSLNDSSKIEQALAEFRNIFNSRAGLTRKRLKDASRYENDVLHILFRGWSDSFIDRIFWKANLRVFYSFDHFIHELNYQLFEGYEPNDLYMIDEIALSRNYEQIGQKLWSPSGPYRDNLEHLNQDRIPGFSLDGEIQNAIAYFWQQNFEGSPVSVRKLCSLLGIDYIEYQGNSNQIPGWEDIYYQNEKDQQVTFSKHTSALEVDNTHGSTYQEYQNQLNATILELAYVYSDGARISREERLKQKDILEFEMAVLEIERWHNIYELRLKNNLNNSRPEFLNELGGYAFNIFHNFIKLIFNDELQLRKELLLDDNYLNRINEIYQQIFFDSYFYDLKISPENSIQGEAVAVGTLLEEIMLNVQRYIQFSRTGMFNLVIDRESQQPTLSNYQPPEDPNRPVPQIVGPWIAGTPIITDQVTTVEQQKGYEYLDYLNQIKSVKAFVDSCADLENISEGSDIAGLINTFLSEAQRPLQDMVRWGARLDDSAGINRYQFRTLYTENMFLIAQIMILDRVKNDEAPEEATLWNQFKDQYNQIFSLIFYESRDNSNNILSLLQDYNPMYGEYIEPMVGLVESRSENQETIVRLIDTFNIYNSRQPESSKYQALDTVYSNGKPSFMWVLDASGNLCTFDGSGDPVIQYYPFESGTMYFQKDRFQTQSEVTEIWEYMPNAEYGSFLFKRFTFSHSNGGGMYNRIFVENWVGANQTRNLYKYSPQYKRFVEITN